MTIHPSAAEAAVARRLQQAATKLFASRGFESTTVQQIVDEAGVTKGSMYHYFDSKDDLLHQIYARMLAEQTARLEKFAATTEPVETRLHTVAADVIMTTIANLDDSKIFFRSMHLLRDAKQREVRAERRRYHERFRDLVTEGQNTGRFRGDVPADLVVDYFFGSVHHLGMWYQADGKLSALRIATHFADLLLGSLRPTPAD